MNGVKVMVLYDIPSDRLRSKIFQACLDQGLEHWQNSIFIGDLSLSRRKELIHKISILMEGQLGRVHVQPIGAKEFDSAWIRI